MQGHTEGGQDEEKKEEGHVEEAEVEEEDEVEGSKEDYEEEDSDEPGEEHVPSLWERMNARQAITDKISKDDVKPLSRQTEIGVVDKGMLIDNKENIRRNTKRLK